ncbi:MAG: DUF1697 domain-containing protein [Myxococcales bacterium]|nr:MAG: DUF1697 domain-containing protein [Myxococcales bacterium]
MAGTQRYVAFLRGVSPLNCKMAELQRALEQGGFTSVKTVLSSGNALFMARTTAEAALARRVEEAMNEHLGRSFFTQVRSVAYLRELLDAAPFERFQLAADAKRVVTFLSEPPPRKLKLPVEVDGARILATAGSAVFTAYVRSPKGPVFMTLLEKTFGKNITTRTWDTVAKCAS